MTRVGASILRAIWNLLPTPGPRFHLILHVCLCSSKRVTLLHTRDLFTTPLLQNACSRRSGTCFAGEEGFIPSISGVTTSEFPAQSEFPSKGGGKEVRKGVQVERHMTVPGDPEPVLGLVSSVWVKLTPQF